MSTAVIIESRGRYISKTMARAAAEDLEIKSYNSLTELDDFKPALLVICQNAKTACALKKIKCTVALLPGSQAPELLESIDAECVVTYGMSARDSITASSIRDDGIVMAVLRELPKLDGGIEERREIAVHGEETPEKLMAAAGALLIMGGTYSGTTLNIMSI